METNTPAENGTVKDQTSRPEYCQHNVWRPRMFGPSGCGNKAKGFADGKWHCGSHSPEAEARRKAKQDAKYKRFESKLEQEAQNRRAAQAINVLMDTTTIGAPPLEKIAALLRNQGWEEAADICDEALKVYHGRK